MPGVLGLFTGADCLADGLGAIPHDPLPKTRYDMQKSLYGNRLIGTDLANPDFVRLAESFGITGRRVTDPDGLRRVLEQCLAANEPALIEVPVGEMPSPWPFIDLPKVRGTS